ncbi:MAG: type II toxin-antitoxin system RelE/ParE family toxin [Candidatus Peregrinibacteria bacterium]|nr:type II toxin-antitoxin system RelE/ParE family toxin [Candidatus Peregrinibacteria bacterium]MDZ4244788.1 type II toxin-antitoxin system RelE/ParE family toxin [Candidatus Gracilibacteria bacterium]
MIKEYKCKETEKIFNRTISLKLPKDIQKVALRKLNMIHAAISINDLRTPPGNHLEKLTGDRKDQHSIKINDQWRICFQWKENNAYNVEIVDYH